MTTVVSSAPPVRDSHRDRARRAKRAAASQVSPVERPMDDVSSLDTKSQRPAKEQRNDDTRLVEVGE